MFKFADGTYLLTGSSQAHTTPSELHLISTWTSANNLTLNNSKSKEMIFFRPRHQFDPPPPLPNITRVKTLKILSVILQDNLKLTDHLTATWSSQQLAPPLIMLSENSKPMAFLQRPSIM